MADTKASTRTLWPIEAFWLWQYCNNSSEQSFEGGKIENTADATNDDQKKQQQHDPEIVKPKNNKTSVKDNQVGAIHNSCSFGQIN